MLGAHPAWPGKVPSVHSKHGAHAHRAGQQQQMGFFVRLMLQSFFSPAETKEFSLSRGAQCPGHPEKIVLGLVLGLAGLGRMPMAKPLHTRTKHLHKILIYHMVKESIFLAFCDADCAPPACVLLS